MLHGYRAVLKGDRLEWMEAPPNVRNGGVPVYVFVIPSEEEDIDQRRKRLLEAFERLRRTARWLTQAKTTPIGDADWENYEAVILFWIRQSRLTEGIDRKLLDILRPWLEQKWTFDGHLFLTNEQFEQQVSMFEDANLQLRIEVQLPKQRGKFRAYT